MPPHPGFPFYDIMKAIMTTVPIQTTQERPGLIRVPASYADYLAWEPDNAKVEWKDGEIITYMPATDRHQQIVIFLAYVLNTLVELLGLGRVQIGPFEAKLWPDGPAREPDVLFVSANRAERFDDRRFNGAPDLVIEVVSAGSARIDKVDKFIEYEQAGVREYWVIDPRPRQQQADFYRRDEAGRLVPAPLDDDGIYHSAVLPGFWLDPEWLRDDPLPNVSLKTAEIAKDLANLSDDVRAAYRHLYDVLSRLPAA